MTEAVYTATAEYIVEMDVYDTLNLPKKSVRIP